MVLQEATRSVICHDPQCIGQQLWIIGDTNLPTALGRGFRDEQFEGTEQVFQNPAIQVITKVCLRQPDVLVAVMFAGDNLVQLGRSAGREIDRCPNEPAILDRNRIAARNAIRGCSFLLSFPERLADARLQQCQQHALAGSLHPTDYDISGLVQLGNKRHEHGAEEQWDLY
ncbi:MAG: hypothetical protein R3C59_03930 [Planctomycetaceae bacterium]